VVTSAQIGARHQIEIDEESKPMWKLIVLFILLISSVSQAADHLEPESSQPFLPDYYEMVIEAFYESYDHNVIVRAFVLPSNMPEYAVGIKKESGAYKVFYLITEFSYWLYRTFVLERDHSAQGPHSKYITAIEKKYPEGFKQIKVDRCEAQLDSNLAVEIIDAWTRMLEDTKHPQDTTGGFDGTTYHFSMRQVFRIMSGKTWSPSPRSKPGLLVSVAESMIDYCKDSYKSEMQLTDSVQRLRRNIKRDDARIDLHLDGSQRTWSPNRD